MYISQSVDNQVKIKSVSLETQDEDTDQKTKISKPGYNESLF